MENQAVELIGRKQQAAALLYGESSGGGLSALNGNDGGNLLAALAAEIDGDASITDLRDLFARHARESDPADSAWYAAEATDDRTISESASEPVQVAPEVTDPLLHFVTESLGRTVTDVSAEAPLPVLMPRPAPLPPRRKPARRRKINLLDAPADEPLPVLDILTGASDQRPPVQKLPVLPPVRWQEAVQLSLF